MLPDSRLSRVAWASRERGSVPISIITEVGAGARLDVRKFRNRSSGIAQLRKCLLINQKKDKYT